MTDAEIKELEMLRNFAGTVRAMRKAQKKWFATHSGFKDAKDLEAAVGAKLEQISEPPPIEQTTLF